MGKTRMKRWPVEPIEDALAERGSTVHTLATQRGMHCDIANKLADMYRNGVRDRYLSLKAMDAICCEALGVHPYVIYGADYFSYEFDPENNRTPCARCGGAKEENCLHLCLACKAEVNAARKCLCGCEGDIPKGSKARYVEGHSPSYRIKAARKKRAA